MTHSIHRCISVLLIALQIFSTIPGYTYEGMNSLDELTQFRDDTDTDSSESNLIREHDLYMRDHPALSGDVTTFESSSPLMGATYMIKQSSRLTGNIGGHIVTSDLLYDTMIRNMSHDTLDPSALGVQSISTAHQVGTHLTGSSSGAIFDLSRSGSQLIRFEFGIPENHLIFSKPVRLSVNTTDIPDGAFVDLRVQHAGDADYNTSGLMIDPLGECLPDGTASIPATRAQVIGSQVSFYTCGASTFALGYVPARDLPNLTVSSLSSQSDGKVILGGNFTTVGGITMGRVARVSAIGTIDTTFTNPNVNNTVYATAIQPDGKILIGGIFTTVGGTTRNYIARLNTDGTLDATFNPNITVVGGNEIRAITIQTDGKILIGGIFTTVGGTTRNRIARLNTDGTLDLTFNPNANAYVYAITIQTDGKILIGGGFNLIGGIARSCAARLNTDGTLDATWNPNSNGGVSAIQLFTTGEVILAGSFTTIGGTTRNRIAKVSTLGVLDATFNPNANNTVGTLNIDSSNNVILGGDFITIGGITRNRIARVSASGVLDATFNPNANSTVNALGRDIDNNLLVGGAFTTMNGKATPYFAWVGLSTDTTPPQILSISLASGALLPIGNFTVTTTYTDTGAGIDTGSIVITLEKWNGTTWGLNIAPTYLSASGATTSTGTQTFAGVPYGKYRFRFTIADVVVPTNRSILTERIFYIDAIAWSVSQPSVDIGNVVSGIQKNSNPSEFIIMVQTVGAPFSLTMSGSELQYMGQLIPHWSAGSGYGYEQYVGAYSGTLSSLSGGVLIMNQGANIDINGNKNTYTYRIQYGTNVGAEQPAGDYIAPVSLQLVTNY